jgi:hypothetical protein
VVAVGAIASSAFAANVENAFQCDKRRGYFGASKPPVFYNYAATVAGARRHVQNAKALPGVLLPSFAYPDGTVFIRFDTFPTGWRVNLAYHAGCEPDGTDDENAGYLGWEIATDRNIAGVVCDQNRSLSCFAKTRVNIGGRIVTRLTIRGRNDTPPIYTFSAGRHTYWVNGRRPQSPGYTQAEHNKWVESRIRTARRVG